MKKSLMICVLLVFAVSCSPTVAVTEVAISTPTQRPTYVPLATRTPKPTLVANATSVQHKTSYILEVGYCFLVMNVGDVSGQDIKNITGCSIQERQQVQLADFDWLELSYPDRDMSDKEIFCALFTIDGKLVMSAIDRQGSYKVSCGKYQ